MAQHYNNMARRHVLCGAEGFAGSEGWTINLDSAESLVGERVVILRKQRNVESIVKMRLVQAALLATDYSEPEIRTMLVGGFSVFESMDRFPVFAGIINCEDFHYITFGEFIILTLAAPGLIIDVRI